MSGIFTAVLTAIPSRPRTQHAGQIAETLDLDRDHVVQVAHRLKRRGLVAIPSIGLYQRTEAGDALVAAGGIIKPGPMRPGIDAADHKRRVRPPRKDALAGGETLRERAWSALRVLGKATALEILELAANGSEGRDPEGNLVRYLNRLARFGVVMRLDQRAPGVAPTSNGHIRYSLIRNVGPKAPLWRPSIGMLIDRNSGTPIDDEIGGLDPVSRRRRR